MEALQLISDDVRERPNAPATRSGALAGPRLGVGARAAGGLVLPPRSEEDRLEALLRDRFGIPAFRPWQREAIDALLREDGRVLLVAPTGGGKSLCYQLPAVALPGTTLVLSPLISLMEDQVRGLEARGIAATFIASSLPREENARRLAGVRRGDYALVYAAPERLAFDGFLDALASSRLALVAVDEAHCIVQWGHDFRPDYLRIGAAIARLRPPRVLACTATATPDARDEIVRRLGWEGAPFTVVLRGFARPNLHLAVREVSGPRDAFALTEAALEGALGAPANGGAAGGGRGLPRATEARDAGGAAIVYAATRKSAERLTEQLCARGFAASSYHAGLPPEERARVSAGFAARELPVVVATNAFGMGIDRPDVRIVVHAQPPSSIEAYYQEVGRAGRDGAPSQGLLLIAGADIALRRRMCDLGPDGAAASATDASRAWGQFRELLRYVDAATCRHDFILRHFGDEAESLGGCGHCDVCLALAPHAPEAPSRGGRERPQTPASDDASERLVQDRDVVRRALAGVARAKGGAGMQAIAAMLAGQRTPRVEQLGLAGLSTFGVLGGKSAEQVLVVLRVLLANGWIDLSSSEYPVPLLTPLGWQVMRGDLEVRVRLPDPRPAAVAPRGRPRAAPTVRAEPVAELAGRDRELFDALRAYRLAVARDRGVPPYVIATDRTLAELAVLRPRTEEELHLVRGVGPAKVAAYGQELLRLVREAAS